MIGASGAGAAAAVANAIKASGVLVRVSPEDFQALLRRARDPLLHANQVPEGVEVDGCVGETTYLQQRRLLWLNE